MAQLVGSRVLSATLAATTSAAAALAWHTTNGMAVSSDCEKPVEQDFRVEVHLMDKIQQKEYLDSAQDGIPSTLRVLAIDLPEMRRHAFSGECHLAHDKVFLDDIAPPKIVRVGEDKRARSADEQDMRPKLRIAQKTLVKSLVQCRSPQSQQRVGVELLEASISDLNRYKLRKTHQLGNFKYDPGKYYGSSDSDPEKWPEFTSDDDDEIVEVDQDTYLMEQATFEDEMEAPWNQYAWAEEMRLRVNGQVGFSAPVERSSRWSRLFFGQSYRITNHSLYRFWELPLPTFAKSDPDGIDGRNRTSCRACNKPHAVIANGATMQRVPSSLRLLQKICRKADVPLYVIHDPRVWGGNTHQSLPEALREMRGTIKNRVIRNALKQQGSSAFTRGRMLGQAETEAKWQVKEQKRKSKELFGGKNRKLRKAESDWSHLDVSRLERKLMDRHVIQETHDENEGISSKIYSPALVKLSRRCIKDMEEQEEEAEAKLAAESPAEPVVGSAATL